MISTLLSLWTVSTNFTFFSFLADLLDSSHYFYKYFVTDNFCIEVLKLSVFFIL